MNKFITSLINRVPIPIYTWHIPYVKLMHNDAKAPIGRYLIYRVQYDLTNAIANNFYPNQFFKIFFTYLTLKKIFKLHFYLCNFASFFRFIKCQSLYF